MKKHDEGYVLAYVMIVIVILMLVATSVLSVALGNLQKQKAAVEQMQAKYAAEGAIERTIVELKEINTHTLVHNLEFDDVEIRVVEDTVEGSTCHVLLLAVGKPLDETLGSRVIVTCELKLVNSQTIMSELSGETVYTLDHVQEVDYVSYQISTVEEAGGGGET